MKRIFLSFISLVCLLHSTLVFCSETPPGTIDKKFKYEAVLRIADIYNERYVYADLGEKMADLLRQNLKAGHYNTLQTGKELARQLTRDMRSISPDFHLTIAYVPQEIEKRKKTPPEQIRAEEAADSRRCNHGFSQIQILEGNVGYLKMTRFEGSREALQTAAAALHFLGNAHALILDLRFNPGGDPKMVQFLASYFLGHEPVLLDEFHYRQGRQTEQLWSLPYVPGETRPHIPLYLLIDHFTFSSAEGLAYDLQAQKQAIVVGTPSAGGAHITETETLMDSFLLYIPVGYSRNPLTQTHFQGKGVIPDVVLNEETALHEVHVLALENHIKSASEEKMKQEMSKILQKLKNPANADRTQRP